MGKQQLDQKTRLSLLEAAQLIASESSAVHDVEAEIARAIEHGQLQASVKRWATEQWEGKQLPGNINRRETYIELSELEAWRKTSAGT